MSSIPEKTEAARREEEERMEIERGVKLLDTSMEDTTDQDGKRSRVDSLSSHFVKICGLGSAEVFEPEDSTHPPLSMAPLPSATSRLPHSYRMARTARRNWMSVTLAGVGPYCRTPLPAGCGFNCGSFELPGDDRQLLVQNFHRVHDRTNVSMSVNPKDLVCLTCPEKHAFVKPGLSPPPVCISLTDQSFPPFVSASMSESCVAVLRVEDGKLSDLDKLFRDVFREHVTPVGRLPQGSVVLVGSVTHLSLSGLSNYAEELVKVIRSISVSAGQGTTVIPSVPLLLGGITCPVLVRLLMDIDSWILSSQLPPNLSLPVTRNLVWDKVKCDNPTTAGAATAVVTAHSLDMPISIRHPRKTRTLIGGPPPPSLHSAHLSSGREGNHFLSDR